MDITLRPGQVTKCLGTIVVCLILAHVVGQICYLGFGHDYVYGLVPLFDLNREANVPTFYSALVLLFCSVLLRIVACTQKGTHRFLGWGVLAAVFLFLAADEVLAIHERLAEPLRSALDLSGYLRFA